MKLRVAGLAAGLVAAAAIAAARPAGADGGQDQTAAANERCANRLSIAFTGNGAAPEAMAAADPKAAIAVYLQGGDFQERFARFINSQFNTAPGATYLEDAVYYLAKQVLSDGTPWSQMFLGKFRIAPVASQAAIFADDNGLGYFRMDDWYARYEGNEQAGIKLATAYQILNNVVGLQLTASTNAPGADVSANGRHASPCNSCHFEGWSALDVVASVLPKKGQPFDAYQGPAVQMLGGQMIGNDEQLVTALVASENYAVNACRLSFKFLYGRADNACDGPVLDRCVDAFKAQQTIQSALSSIANEPGFCE